MLDKDYYFVTDLYKMTNSNLYCMFLGLTGTNMFELH